MLYAKTKSNFEQKRHLAQEWDQSGDLKKIEVLVLLDLLGAPNPTLPNYYPSTSWLFNKLVHIEQRLTHGATKMFDLNSPLTYRGHIMQDDHLPFLHRGVDIIHAIPYPFPEVWHKQTVSKNERENGVVFFFCI